MLDSGTIRGKPMRKGGAIGSSIRCMIKGGTKLMRPPTPGNANGFKAFALWIGGLGNPSTYSKKSDPPSPIAVSVRGRVLGIASRAEPVLD
jgi:hypothetical protein